MKSRIAGIDRHLRLGFKVASLLALAGLTLALVGCKAAAQSAALPAACATMMASGSGEVSATTQPGAALTAVPAAPGAVSVEIIAFSHPPLRPVLAEVGQLLATYGDRVHVTHYDFDTPEGAAFAKKKGLSGHIPLVIFVNGKDTFTLNERKVTFESFPQGQGTGMVPDGAWTVADLDAVVKQMTAK